MPVSFPLQDAAFLPYRGNLSDTVKQPQARKSLEQGERAQGQQQKEEFTLKVRHMLTDSIYKAVLSLTISKNFKHTNYPAM